MNPHDIVHHFGPTNLIRGVPVGVYMKQSKLRRGYVMPMHLHTHGHLSLLSQGHAILAVDGKTRPLVAPCVITIEEGKAHSLEAVTDIVWFCIHATDETDPDQIDERLTT